jgi:isopenicillin N synthase-like dioxygenase
MELPIVDVAPLVARKQERDAAAASIGAACRTHGFFYVGGHGVDDALQERLARQSRAFFAQDVATKLEIGMARGGRAWRGYFPVGGELTSGKPDRKEGLYFGAELDDGDPLVRARTPLHGRNLFPSTVPGFAETVLAYMHALTLLGHALMEGVALSLGLEASYFAERYMSHPLTLFRVFNYPAQTPADGAQSAWGVGEHTDYGVLTILKQDGAGGLQVKTGSHWIDAPPVPGTFVCNIGDMLDRMTGGLYRSTPHRVRNASAHDRLSFPFFFDPNWDAEIAPIAGTGGVAADDRSERWDRASVHEFGGTYGDYVLSKVAKVFPTLRETAL